MKKISLVLVFSFLFTLSVNAEPQKVNIGVITALTGNLATIGTAVKNGIELAREDAPELFINTTFFFEDDQYDAKQSISAYRKLTSVDNIDLLLGFGAVLARSVGPLTEQEEIPFINFNFEFSSARNKKYLIRSFNPTYHYMEMLSAHIVEQKAEEIYVLGSATSFFDSMIAGLRNSIGSNIRINELNTLNPSDLDFRSIILRLKQKKSKFLGLFLLPDQLIAFMKQAKELQFYPTYFGTDLYETSASLSEAEKLFDGCLYPDNNVSEDFRRRYKKKFGNEAQLTFAGNAYDITLLTGELLQSYTRFQNEQFLNDLKKIRSRSGVLGTYNYKYDSDYGQYMTLPIFVKAIKDRLGVVVN